LTFRISKVLFIGREKMQTKIVLNFVLALVLTACGTAPVSPASSPTTIPTSIPPTNTLTPTLVPTETPQPDSPFLSFPAANCCKARTVEAGEYELPAWLVVPLTVDVEAGWGVLNEKAARLFLLAGPGRNEFNDPSQVLVFIVIPDADPQAVLTPIQTSPQLTSVSEITETTIAGFSGWQFDATAKPNPENEGSRQEGIPPGSQYLTAIGKYFTPGFLWTTWTAEPRMRFLALDAGGHVLLAQIESPPAEYEAFASEAEQLLRTLELTQ
jgi:hypothetical protein